ncbi:MAG: glycosyltransferase family 2 protein [Candidatus Acidiferrales bacterium]|jgi:dolichol-phosphate mannosyltransferase
MHASASALQNSTAWKDLDISAAPLELAVVIPTFEERENIWPILDRLAEALTGIHYEVIFVDDDSRDGTADCIREIARHSTNVHVIQRVHRRGLGSACIEGMMATAAPYIAVMDADLQHDERILPRMFATLKNDRLDLVVATRNATGGSMGEFAWHRVLLSNLGQRLSKSILRMRISDPMSGFFVLTRDYLEEVIRSTSGIGFKLLVDLVASARRPLRIGEIPYTFRERAHGSSKLDVSVCLEFVQLVLDKKIGNLVPVRFLIFGAVGVVGVLLASVVLSVLVLAFRLDFLTAQVITTFIAMTGNFFLNNSMTYRDRRLKRWGIVTGLASFYAACSLGAVINLHIAKSAKDLGIPWYIAGACGLAVGAVWNYGITSFTTWRRARVRSGA